MGRAASQIAKMLLQGEQVQLVNAEKMVILGNRHSLVERYQQRRRLQNKGKPEHSPHWPRVPHMLVKRIIRGMLPWKKTRGREAFRRLRVYSGIPKDAQSAGSLDSAQFNKQSRSITVMELCKHIGFNG